MTEEIKLFYHRILYVPISFGESLTYDKNDTFTFFKATNIVNLKTIRIFLPIKYHNCKINVKGI